MLTRFAEWQGRTPQSVAADTTYGNGEFLQWLADRGITPYMRTRDSIHTLFRTQWRKKGVVLRRLF